MQGGIERAFLGAQHVAGCVLDRGHDGVAMQARPLREDLQNQQIERALQGIRFGHTQSSEYTYVWGSRRLHRKFRGAYLFLLTPYRNVMYTPVGSQEVAVTMAQEKPDVLHGSLILMVLRTLDTLGPQHGWGIARRIEQVSGDALELKQGTLYPALLRLEQMGCIASKWGASANNRRAKFYAITAAR